MAASNSVISNIMDFESYGVSVMMNNQDRLHPVHTKYKFNVETDRSTCQLCSSDMKGKHSGNLLRHLKRNHPLDYKQIMEKRSKMCPNTVINSTSKPRPSCSSTSNSAQPSITFYIENPKKEDLNVELTLDAVKDACVELVTENGRPFSLLEDSGFRKIINPILAGLGNKYLINQLSIEEDINQRVVVNRAQLTLTLHAHKVISLKVDSVTRNGKSILAINAQYIEGEAMEVVVKTLAVKQLKGVITSDIFNATIVDVLKEYQLSPKQVYSLTTDNGINVLQTFQIDTDHYVEILRVERDQESKQFNICENNLSHLQTMGVLVSGNSASQFLHNAAKDFLGHKSLRLCLISARHYAKQLKVSSMLKHFEDVGRPVEDCETRWTSTFIMLERMQELKTVCINLAESEKDLYFSSENWEIVANILKVLEPVKIACEMSQSEQLTLTDFYNVWIRCKLEVTKIKSNISTLLGDSLTLQEAKLMRYEPLLACMYLDPRYQILLDNKSKLKAKLHLCAVYQQLEQFIVSEETCFNIVKQEVVLLEEDDQVFDEVELMLLEKENEKKRMEMVPFGIDPKCDIRSELEQFDNIERLPIKTNILAYWKGQEFKHPHLHDLAKIVFAVPATRNSLERSFMAIQTISSSEPSDSSKLLEDVLYLRLNK